MEKLKRILIPGKKYCISVNGQKAVNIAKELQQGKCYKVIESNGEFAAQMEIVLDDDTIYNGYVSKWVSFSFIPCDMVSPVISWLQENGFSLCNAVISEEDSQTTDYIEEHEEINFVIPWKTTGEETEQLSKNQLVLFDDGHKASFPEVFYSSKYKAFAYTDGSVDSTGKRIIHYSNTIIEKPERKKKAFIPSKKNCPIEIFPCGQTEKAYQLEDGSNGKIGHCKIYYKYIAKSVCYIDDSGRIFAPVFAVK